MIAKYRNRRGEEGAVALLVAISMVGLCVVAGLVIDLGLLRVDRQADKSAEDAAALAGVDGLISDANSPTLHPFAGVCQAMNYLKVNSKQFSSFSSSTWTNGSGGAITGDPDGCSASHASDVCTKNAPTTWARWVGTTADGVSRVTIQSGYKTVESNAATDGNFSTVTGGAFGDESLSAYSADPGDPTYGGCDQIGVVVSEVKNTTLGSPAAKTMGTRLRSVARVKIVPPTSPFALLILNRHDCQVLSNTSNGIVDVLGYKTHPGLIHVDSSGKNADGSQGANCNSKPVLQGAKINGIVAHEAPDTNEPGQIGTVATTNQTDGTANVHSGPLPYSDPVTSTLMTRSLLDTIYQAGVQTAIKNAWDNVLSLPSAPSGFTTKPCPNNDTWTEAKIYVNCANVNMDVTMTNATDVFFKGTVSTKNVLMPKAIHVYIKGGSGTGVSAGSSSGGSFEMNNGSVGTACPSSFDTTKTRAQLFLARGDFKTNGGNIRLCNTTFILMGGDQYGCVPTSTPTYFETTAVCPFASPTGPGDGVLNMGGNTFIDWTAPDIVDDDVRATDAQHLDLEDLALWTETAGAHTLGGNGKLHLMGVFAAPNADLKFGGLPTNSVTNSQYVARTLQTNGNGKLSLTPLPSLPVAPPTITYQLVR